MAPNLLILGGTTEASQLARRVADLGLAATFSYAGRVEAPISQPTGERVGGFGGAEGLAAYLRDNAVTHLIDATHPFADGISRNAVEAADLSGVPLVALTRPAWTPIAGDNWQHVPDMAAAADALPTEARTIFLSIGKQQLDVFATRPEHRYVLRTVSPLDTPPPMPIFDAIVARGPFELADERDLLAEKQVDLLVTKNSGGAAAQPKLDAARELKIPVLVIDRPPSPVRDEVQTVEAVLDWVHHTGTDLGV